MTGTTTKVKAMSLEKLWRSQPPSNRFFTFESLTGHPSLARRYFRVGDRPLKQPTIRLILQT